MSLILWSDAFTQDAYKDLLDDSHFAIEIYWALSIGLF
jgi:hypothetical protein